MKCTQLLAKVTQIKFLQLKNLFNYVCFIFLKWTYLVFPIIHRFLGCKIKKNHKQQETQFTIDFVLELHQQKKRH